MSLAPLFRLENQFQAKNGRNLTAGYLLVFLAGTDDPAETFSDYVGTRNPERIVLDDNGRAVVICDDSVAYRLEVYDPEGMLQWTEEPVYCTGSGGGSGDSVEVESTDGSVSVTETTAGGVRYFDLSVAGIPDEPLDWIRAEASGVSDGSVYPAKVDGTMSSTPQGIPVVAGRFYHVTVPVRVVPAGTGTAYDTLSVALEDGNGAICSRDFDIDSSLTDAVELEFSYDYEAPSDGFVFLSVGGTSPFVSVDVVLMAHRVFNGYSSEYAKKTWVGNYFVQNSSLDIQSGTITGISGTPIGGIAEATVSSIASSYAESAASSKLDSSAFTSYTASALTGIQQDTAAISSAVSSLESSKVDQSAFDSCCSAVEAQVSAISSDVSAIRQDTGAISAAVSGLTGEYIQYAALESASGKITGISGTALWGGHEYSGVWPIVVDNTAEMISATNKTLAVDETMTGYASGDSAVIGVNTSTVLSGLTAYQPTSEMTAYQLSGDYYSASNPSGFITGVDLSDYATTAYVDSSVSGKLDTTAFNSGDFYSTSNPSGFITGVDLSDYATTGYVDSSVSGKADSSALTAYQPVSAMTGYQPSGDYYSASNPSGFITGVDLSDYATTGYVDSSISGKQDASAMTAYQPSGDYYSASNPSGFITGVDLSDYATTSYVDSSVSGKLDASASGDFYSTSNPSGFITGVDLSNYATTGYVDSSVSGKQDASAMTAYQPAGDYQPSGDYLSATESSNYLLTSQSGMFQPSGYYQPSGDYAFNSSLADYQPASAMTAYQEITGMSAYQPSGDYIYASSLGTGVI